MIPAAGKEKKILVVGTTPDYVEWIRQADPGRCLFLTDTVLRPGAKEPDPGAEEEILCDLADYRQAGVRLEEHLTHRGTALDGIACFDCESMELAALLAERYARPYPSVAAIGLCRDKYLSKGRWRENGLACPRARSVNSPGEAERFQAELAAPVVLKPLTGSGSEYVYLCPSVDVCRINYGRIASALAGKRFNRLYRSGASTSATVPVPVVAEEFIAGEEYSCDFTIANGRVGLIRLTKKIRAPMGPFGITHGYVLGPVLPEGIGAGAFLETLGESARSLQIERGICMLDFMVRDGEIVLLELAPRPGGDCLPQLLRKAWGFDIIKFGIDFAGRREEPLTVPPRRAAPEFMGMRIIGKERGIIKEIDVRALGADSRVLEIGLTKGPGDTVVMPPEDYDSWILGYAIARLDPGRAPAGQLRELDGKIDVIMEQD